MAKPRINVSDNEAWGKLVKTWATGKNYIEHQPTEQDPIPKTVEIPPKWPKPTSFEDFVGQCIKAKVGLFFEYGQNTPVLPSDGLGFILLQATSDTSVLRLPAKEKIEESEARLLGGERYGLPGFYRRVFGKDVDDAEVAAKVQKMKLHAERVGEYTINTCH